MKLFKKIMFATAAIAVCASSLSLAACADPNTIYVDTNAFFAPFEYYDESGKIVGVDIEIMEKVGAKLNKNVKFENTEFNVIIDNVSSGKKYDCGAAGITVTDERKEKVDFSNPYYTAVQYVIFKTGEMTTAGTSTDGKATQYISWEQLGGKKIGVQMDTTGDIFVGDEMGKGGVLFDAETNKTIAGTELKKYTSAPVAINALGTEINAIVVDELPAKYLVNKNSGLECYPLYYDAATATEEEYAICVTKGNNELLDAINAVLTELGTSGINALVAKHLGVTE